ncbi:MAG: type II toxin-antitoxin system RelE/ParE family toxin [Bradyrhizobium sp.]
MRCRSLSERRREADVVHVLHAFQQKTQATAKRDIDLAKARLRQIR